MEQSQAKVTMRNGLTARCSKYGKTMESFNAKNIDFFTIKEKMG
jgi:hypothetical protein